MTSANDVIAVYPALRAAFDPADSDFRMVSESLGSFESAVLSVLSGRQSFWITHALAFGYADDIEGSVFRSEVTAGSGDIGAGQYKRLFGTGTFDRSTPTSTNLATRRITTD